MKKSKHSESQILKILSEHENGRKVTDLCREHGISQPTFYKWKSKYGGMQLKELESKLNQNKKMYAELAELHSQWGFWMMHYHLRENHYRWNHKRVY